ncbi:MAG: MFS transporter [Myxococcales bacterium]|nr:MFS transporter [Myxococcales bacterium]
MSAVRPRSLFVLCLVEFWERTAGVLCAALLVLFLTEARGLTPSAATALSGSFLALTYFTPLIGGFFADRAIGPRVATQLGALICVGGYAALALFPAASPWWGLGLIALGQGCFRPGITSSLARLYVPNPELRDHGYSLFYLSVNVGGALGPLLGSAVKRLYGWSSVFVLASSLMMLSVVSTLWLPASERTTARSAPTGNAYSPTAELKTALPYLAIFVVYMSVYAQTSGALLLFARDHVQRSILGHAVAVESLAAFPSAFVLTATPLVSAVIHRLRRQHREPATVIKIIAGLLVTAAAFVVLSVVSRHVRADQKVAFIWLGLSLALMSTGELLVVPMMQSLVGQLAPKSAFTTAFLFVAMSAGYTCGGWVGTLYERLSAVGFWGVCTGMAGMAVVGMMRLRKSGDDSKNVDRTASSARW